MYTTLRKILINIPNLRYWVSPLMLAKNVRLYLESMCCELFGFLEKYPTAAAKKWATMQMDHSHLKSFKLGRDLSSMAFNSFMREPLDPELLFRGIMGLKDKEGKPILDDFEQANLPQFMLGSYIAKPLVDSLLPKTAKNLVKTLGSMFTHGVFDVEPPTARDEEINRLKSQIQTMEKKLKAQAKKMNTLWNKLK